MSGSDEEGAPVIIPDSRLVQEAGAVRRKPDRSQARSQAREAR